MFSKQIVDVKKGFTKEDVFAELVSEHYGVEVGRSSKEQDVNEHWDVKLKYNGLKEDVRIDVKGVKSERGEYHYLEILNVRGDAGWLYGEADAFAFETNNYWILVEKGDAQNFIKEKISELGIEVDNILDYCSEEIHKDNELFIEEKLLYKLYTRRKFDRKDLMMKVYSEDLFHLAYDSIEKKSCDKKKRRRIPMPSGGV